MTKATKRWPSIIVMMCLLNLVLDRCYFKEPMFLDQTDCVAVTIDAFIDFDYNIPGTRLFMYGVFSASFPHKSGTQYSDG